MGDFGGINIGLSGLHAARKGLDVTGHNIANVSTEGFTRQRVSQTGVGSSRVPAFFAKSDGVGAGVQTGDTTRVLDGFLDARALAAQGEQSRLETLSGSFRSVEDAFREPGETGIGVRLDELWSSFDEVANRPDDLSARAQVLERANSLTDGIHNVAGDLQTQRTAAVDLIGTRVGEANAIAKQVASLNAAVREGTNAGSTPNDLLDQRDVLVRKLGELVGATTRDAGSSVVDVFVDGTSLVAGDSARTLAVDVTGSTTKVVWQPGGLDATVSGGQVGGLLTVLNTVLPTYRNGLDAVAAKLVSKLNALHTSGFDLTGTAGLPFFTATAGNEAATIAVNAALVGQPSLIAASGVASAGGNADGSLAATAAESASAPASADHDYRSLVDLMGIQAQSTSRRLEVQAQISKTADDNRQSASGVNLDEEMTQLLSYQHAYDASARFITTVNTTLDTLMGLLR